MTVNEFCDCVNKFNFFGVITGWLKRYVNIEITLLFRTSFDAENGTTVSPALTDLIMKNLLHIFYQSSEISFAGPKGFLIRKGIFCSVLCAYLCVLSL